MIRRNNRRLYESIMRDIARTVKRQLNESIVEQDNFYDYTMEFYNDWLDHISREVIENLISQGKITDGMDFYEAWEQVQEEFDKGLNNAVDGDWWQVGDSVGYSDSELDSIYNDEMQAKTDVFAEYLNEDGDYIQLEDDEDDEDDEQMYYNLDNITPTENAKKQYNKFIRQINNFKKQLSNHADYKNICLFLDNIIFTNIVINSPKFYYYKYIYKPNDRRTKKELLQLFTYLENNNAINEKFNVQLDDKFYLNSQKIFRDYNFDDYYDICTNYDVKNKLNINTNGYNLFTDIIKMLQNFITYFKQNL